MIRRLGRLLASAGIYIGFVVGGTLLVLVGSSVIGYLPYSDRPGPGWHGAGLNAQELKFFLSWCILLVPSVAFWGVVLAVIGQTLAVCRSPLWFLRSRLSRTDHGRGLRLVHLNRGLSRLRCRSLR